jgi:copper chaperone CopZ
MQKKAQLVKIGSEITRELATPEVSRALLATTFKGFSELLMKQAIMEGRMRGFQFKDFLEKNVYAIPYGSGYSLITSIDYARKIAMRSGLAGKSAPVFTYNEDKSIESCTITIKRNVGGVLGEYTATVFFSEYSTGRNLWLSKPKTMIAKVAEMHSLRSAFPEEMAQAYTEEEMQKEIETMPSEERMEGYAAKIETCKTIEELKKVYASMPVRVKIALKELKDKAKTNLQKNENPKI